jgi:predicted dienelactone hydrolase
MKALALILALTSSTLWSADHPVPVGTSTLNVESKAHARKFAAELWFQAAADARTEDFAARPPLRAITIAREAAPSPSTGKRPLIVVSHGNWGSRFSQGWLALELVRKGYMVLSTTHPGTSGDDQTVAGRYRLWDRSRDVSAALDAVLSHPKWAALIDESRIGFVGHSFGGWTAVSLAGGRYDPAQQRAYCEKSASKDFYCDGTLEDDVSRVPAQDAGGSFKDARVRAFYVMATGPGQGFSVQSLAAIDVPFVVETAQFDEILEPRGNSGNLARQIRGAREVVRPVGHFAYVAQCKPVIGALLAKAAGLPLCDDPHGVDRAAMHKQVASDVVEFFGRSLPHKPPV